MNHDVFASLKMDADGWVTIPAKLRRVAGLKPGETVLAKAAENLVFLGRAPSPLDQYQARISQSIPPGVSLVDELLADRRQEARRERTS